MNPTFAGCPRLAYFVTFVIAVGWLAGCTSGPQEIDAQLKDRLVEQIGATLSSQAFAWEADWSRWEESVARHRGDLDAAFTEAELGDALNGALGEFGLSHLWVWTPEDMRVREAGLQGGMGMKTVEIDEGLLVTALIDGGPADDAGLRRGDLIIEVDGAAATRRSLARGAKGSRRSVTFERAGQDHNATVILDEHPRANFATLRWLDDRIALITVPSFSRSFYEDRPLYLQDTVQSFFDEAADAAGIILDVRSNGGGYYLYPEHLAGLFMKPETDTYFVLHVEEHADFLKRGGAPNASLLEMAKASGQVVRPMAIPGRSPYEGPVVVLVDGRTGSGGETFAASVQAAGRGLVIGTRTAGSVLAGNKRRLAGGYELFFPQAEYVMPDGARLEGHGVQPDVGLSPQETVADEVILQVAVEALGR